MEKLLPAIAAMAAMGTAVYLFRENEKLTALLSASEEYTRIQKGYYETLLRREEETRRYRHDMKNHLLCIQALAKEGQLKRLQKYLVEIFELSGQQKSFQTGDSVMDALTNHYTAYLGSDVTVRVQGHLTNADKISSARLCTIYGNLLSNAVESLITQSAETERFLFISMKDMGQAVLLVLKNSCPKIPDYDQNGRLRTGKADTKEHGLGLANVRDCVKKMKGELSLRYEPGVFTAEVVLPVPKRNN